MEQTQLHYPGMRIEFVGGLVFMALGGAMVGSGMDVDGLQSWLLTLVGGLIAGLGASNTHLPLFIMQVKKKSLGFPTGIVCLVLGFCIVAPAVHGASVFDIVCWFVGFPLVVFGAQVIENGLNWREK